MKQCTNCGQIKELEAFTTLKLAKKTNLLVKRGMCKQCFAWKKSLRSIKASHKIKNLPGEIWRSVPNFENVYEVSNKGRIKSLKRASRKLPHGSPFFTQDMIMKLSHNGSGYLKVTLKQPATKVYKNLLVHRLVAQAFLQNPQSLREVNHLDGDKKNNKIENLAWVSSRENKIHAIQLGLMNPVLNLPHMKKKTKK